MKCKVSYFIFAKVMDANRDDVVYWDGEKWVAHLKDAKRYQVLSEADKVAWEIVGKVDILVE